MSEDAEAVLFDIRADVDKLVHAARALYGPFGATGAQPTGEISIPADLWDTFVLRWGLLTTTEPA